MLQGARDVMTTLRTALSEYATGSLPDGLQVWFADHATIPLPQLARLLPMDRGTLARHIEDGRLAGRFKGLGRKRRHRVFTAGDVTRFLERISEPAPCPSTEIPDPPTGNIRSTSTVIDFPVQLGNGMKMRRLLSRKTAKLTLADT
jgi:hypothetical protein